MQIYRADTLIDGSGGAPQASMDIIIGHDGRIQEIVPSEAREYPADARIYTNPGKTVLPGFIDVHTHLMFGEEGRGRNPDPR